MPGFRAAVLIARSAEEVFSYVTDPDNAPKWLPGVTGLKMITEGPLGQGTRLRESRRVGERVGDVDIEVIAHEPPSLYATRFVQGRYDATYQYTFEVEEEGTRVLLACTVAGRGLSKLMAYLVALAMRRQDKGQLKALKKVLEGGGE